MNNNLERKPRMVILGAGESGAGAAVLAQVKGFDTFVSDMSGIKDKYKLLLDQYGIAWEEGHHTEELILNADEVVKSPGIPNDAPLILKLKEKGTPIISEIEFAGRYTDAKMICITGSNGKPLQHHSSTTSSKVQDSMLDWLEISAIAWPCRWLLNNTTITSLN